MSARTRADHDGVASGLFLHLVQAVLDSGCKRGGAPVESDLFEWTESQLKEGDGTFIDLERIKALQLLLVDRIRKRYESKKTYLNKKQKSFLQELCAELPLPKRNFDLKASEEEVRKVSAAHSLSVQANRALVEKLAEAKRRVEALERENGLLRQKRAA